MQEKAYRTLLLWLIWASMALGVYMALYIDTNLWDFMQHDPSKITWLIMGLFALGVVISFGLTMALTQEAVRSVYLGNIVRQKGLYALELKSTRRAVERFFQSIKEVIKANGALDVETLLNVELAPYERTSRAVEIMGNLLITLGLIGTVMGLTLTLAGLTSSLDALGNDQDRLLAGLRRAMGGMGTAFYTTLLGSVLGGVLLRVFALITDNGVEGLSDAMKKICLVYCSADTRPTVEREVRTLNIELEHLGDRAKMLQAALNDSLVAMSNFRNEAVRLKDLGKEEDGEKLTLRDAVVLQQYYANLLKEEVKMMNKVNTSWWMRLRRGLRSTR